MAKRRNNRIALFIIIAVAVFLLFQLGDFPFLSLGTISISDVDVIDNGRRLLIFATIGGGDALDIAFGPSNLNQHINQQGFSSTDSSVLRANYIGGVQEFTFGTSNSNIVNLINTQPSGNVGSIFSPGNLRKCQNEFPNSIASVQRTFPSYVTDCYETRVNGNVNSFTGGETNGFEIEFSLDGEKSILREDVQSITLAGGDAVITWRGNMIGQNEVNAPDFQVFHVGSTWRLVDDNAFSNVLSGLSDFKSTVGQVTDKSTFDVAVQRYNRVVSDNLLTNEPRDAFLRNNPNARSISFSQGVFSVNLETPSFIPTFTVELDAERVGIIKLEGKPQIISCVEDQTFNSAGAEVVTSTIKNIGEEEGFFEFRVTCSNSEMQGSATSQDFRAGETKNVNVLLTGGNTGNSLNEARCTLTVTDRNSRDSDSCGFDFNVEFNEVRGDCIDDETQCSPDGRTLFVCQEGIFQPTLCGEGNICVLRGSESLCVEDTREEGKRGIFDFIRDFFSGLFNGIITGFEILRGTAILVGAIVSGFIAKDLLSRLNAFRKNRLILNLTSLIVAIGVGAFLFTFIGSPSFWLIMGALVVVALLDIFLLGGLVRRNIRRR